MKIYGLCNDLFNLTGIVCRFIPSQKQSSPPLCKHKRSCVSKNFDHQRKMCLERERAVMDSLGKKDFTMNRFPCGLLEIVLPIYSNGSLLGAVFSDKVRLQSREPHGNGHQPVPLMRNQLSGVTSMLTAARAEIKEAVLSQQEVVLNKKDRTFLQRAVDFIEKNYHQAKLPLKQLAKEINASYFYLCRLFKKELGLTYVQYVSLIRLRAALRFLQNLNLTVAQVAYAAGFSDAQYFDRVFKKVLDCSPKEYRGGSAAKKEKIRNKIKALLGR